VHLDKILSINSPSFFRQVPRSMSFPPASPTSPTPSESNAARTLVEVGSPKVGYSSSPCLGAVPNPVLLSADPSSHPACSLAADQGRLDLQNRTVMSPIVNATSTTTTPFLSPICGVGGELRKTGGEAAEERASFPSSPSEAGVGGIGGIERGVWGRNCKLEIFGRREEEEEEVGAGVMEEVEYDHYKEYMNMIGNLRSGVKTPDGKGFDGHFLSAPSSSSLSSSSICVLQPSASSAQQSRPSGKWQAQLYYSGKSRYIGVYDSLAEASLAHEVARETLGAGNEGG
ncbi:hypothetical protein TrRE_jg13136, partial [Triparma retinervis]